MPRGDQTGPMGHGPMTGRAAGFCAGFAVPGFANGIGRAFGRGRGAIGGGGRGWRNMFYATGLTGWQRRTGATNPPAGRDQQVEILKAQAQDLAESLEAIRQRIDQLASADDRQPE